MIEIDKDEHIIFEVRKHWLVFAGEVLVLIILAFIPLIAISFLASSNLDFSKFVEDINFLGLFIFVYSLWLLILWTLTFVFWTSYYLDVWIVTNKRIVDIEQNGLFKREVSILHLGNIQDVTYSIEGPMQSFFNYGNVVVQTAGTTGSFPIKGVPDPDLVQARLNDALVLHNKNLN